MKDWVDGVEVAPGQLVLLENCRMNVGEDKDDETLAKQIAALCDVFVMDAFGTAHRAQASTHGVTQFAKVACAGPLLMAELDALDKALRSPKRPLLAIVAGSKVSTKLTAVVPGRQGRPADRRRRHRQHLHAAAGTTSASRWASRPARIAQGHHRAMRRAGAEIPMPDRRRRRPEFAAAPRRRQDGRRSTPTT